MVFFERARPDAPKTSMPPTSHSGPPPIPSPPRRLQRPEERFSAPPEPADELPPVAPTSVRAPKAAPKAAPKRRHERRHFEQRRRAAPRPTRAASVPLPDLPPSPALERVRANRRRAWKRAGVVAAGLLAVGAGAWALSAPQMNIARVEITGLHATMPALVRPLAAHLLGHNALRADRKGVAREVAALTTVESAHVSVAPALPPVARLHVTERVPVARVGSGNVWWVADARGLPYRRANLHDARLPALTWSDEIQPMRPLEARKWSSAALLAQAIAGQHGALGRIRQIELDASGDAALQVAAPDGTSQITLKLGNDEWPAKLARARVALLYFARTKRDAGELNLISLQLPRWTPRAATSG